MGCPAVWIDIVVEPWPRPGAGTPAVVLDPDGRHVGLRRGP